MIALISIIALVFEPIGPITDEPFLYGIDQIEVIDVIDLGPSIEELERQMQRKNKRIMQINPEDAPQ